MKSSFIISFSDSLVTLRSLNASRFSTNVSIPRTFLEKRGGQLPPLPPPGYAAAFQHPGISLEQTEQSFGSGVTKSTNVEFRLY